MASVKTESILGKLEKIISFRVGENSSGKHKIIAKKGMTPATDGIQIFLPESEWHFKLERDNELALANFTAHESDHIVEFEEYLEQKLENLQREMEIWFKNIVKEIILN